jgi:drug/metabolite transporter (DMT)-like permease
MTAVQALQRRTLIDWLSLLTLVVCWGSNYAITKVALTSITPFWIVSLRTSTALLVLLPIFLLTGQKLPRDRRFWIWMIWVAVVCTMMPLMLISWGTQHVDTNVAGALAGTGPLFVLVIAHFVIPGERVTVPRFFGFVIGFAGVVVLIDPRGGLSGDIQVLIGQLAVVGAALLYGVQVISASIMPAASPLQKTVASVCITASLSSCVAMSTGFDGIRDASTSSLIAAASLGILAPAITGVVNFRLISVAGPSFTSLTSYLIPVYAIVLGFVVFDEQVTLRTLIGMLLVLVGIAVSEIWSKRRRAAAIIPG